MNTRIAHLAFNIGFDIFAVLTAKRQEQRRIIEQIRATLTYLELKVDVTEQNLLVADAGQSVQHLLERILAELRIRHGDLVASYFLLPVNLFITLARLPVRDLHAVEDLLKQVALPANLRTEFQNIRGSYEHNIYDPNDPAPLLNWINQVHELFSEQSYSKTMTIRILFLAANPRDADRIRLDEEVRTIDERLQMAQFRDRFDLKQAWALRTSDLSQALLRYRPHIVHFSGHGSVKGEIILEDQLGKAKPVTPDALGRLFLTLKDNIGCVVLNACFSATQAEAIVKVINCVVGMSRVIDDKAAVQFASGFYRAIGFGRSLQTAFDLGLAEMDIESLAGKETPTMLVKEGVDPAHITFIT